MTFVTINAEVTEVQTIALRVVKAVRKLNTAQ